MGLTASHPASVMLPAFQVMFTFVHHLSFIPVTLGYVSVLAGTVGAILSTEKVPDVIDQVLSAMS